MPLQYGLSVTGKFGAHNNSHNDKDVTTTPRMICIDAKKRDNRLWRSNGCCIFLGTEKQTIFSFQSNQTNQLFHESNETFVSEKVKCSLRKKFFATYKNDDTHSWWRENLF